MNARMLKTWSVFILAATLLLSACARAEDPSHAQTETKTEESTYNGSYIRRPTLLVSDMEKSLSLYRDILGFELGSLKEDGPDSYVFEAFNIPAGTKVRHATLDSDKEKRTLSLVEVKGMKPITNPDGLRQSAVLVNTVNRFDEVAAELKAQNYTLLNPHPLGETGTEMGFIDPDGHLIVIYQFSRK